jgi:hypothetical protein
MLQVTDSGMYRLCWCSKAYWASDQAHAANMNGCQIAPKMANLPLITYNGELMVRQCALDVKRLQASECETTLGGLTYQAFFSGLQTNLSCHNEVFCIAM